MDSTEINDYPKTVLSSLYPVFFGFTLSILFSVKTLIDIHRPIPKGDLGAKAIEVNLCPDLLVWTTLITLILYYIVDWLNSLHNVVNKPDRYTPMILLTLLLSNFVLCALIVSTTFNANYHYFIIGIYLVSATWGWNLIYKKESNPLDYKNKWEGFRLLLALLLLVGGALMMWGKEGLRDSFGLYLFLNACLLGVTIFRVLSLNHKHKTNS